MSLRKNFMKRLSKSASDISGCKKKTYSTSPEEETKDFRTPRPGDGSDDEDIEDDDRRRRASFQSSRSVPGTLATEARSSLRYFNLRSKNAKLRRQAKKQHSEVGIRTVHTAYKAHHGFLALLKERFTRSSSPDREVISLNESPIPDTKHRPLTIDRSNTPEIVRIRGEGATSIPTEQIQTVEILRHPINPDATHADPESNIIGKTAEVVRHKLQATIQETIAATKQATSAKHDSEAGSPKHQNPEEKVKPQHQKSHPPPMVSQGSIESHQSSLPDQRSYVAFQLHVHLKQGHALPAKDSCGTSDPYVKFFLKGRLVHKSKTIYKDLNPSWDEKFTINIDDLSIPLELKVYDYDFAFRDDFIGEAHISILTLELEKSVEFDLILTESGKSDFLGTISLEVKLSSKCDSPSSVSGAAGTPGAGTSSPTFGAKSAADQAKKVFNKLHQHNKTTNVNIVLVEGKDLLAMDLEGTSDPYCKFKLANERYKSKPIYETLNPRWLEQFDLTLYEDHSHELEITVWDKDQRTKDDFMGRCSIDLSTLEPEITHDVWLDIEDGDGKLFLLITISGKTYGKQITDDMESRINDVLRSRYSWRSSLLSSNFFDVGFLEVKIFCAKGLYAADLGGKSDPFAVFELDNSRRRTQTEYKTVSPSWQRVIELPVRDIHSVLYITIYDEDRNHRSEFLGKLAIPLLRIEPGKKRWYGLKDKKLRYRAKGNNPKVLLEMNLVWSTFRAGVRTLNPKEERYLATVEKFKRQIFLSNVMRIKAIVMEFVNLGKFIQSCLEWESPIRSIISFISFLTITYYFEPYMFPVALLLLFLKNYFLMSYLEPRSSFSQSGEDYVCDNDEDEIADDREEDKEEKKTLKARLQAIQDVTAMVQNALGSVASLAEEVKNTFNFSVPFLSWLAVGILIVVTLILYFISLRFLVIVWGINKFAKKLVRPNYVPNNELLDFLSRVPDDEEFLDCRELKPLADNLSSPTKKNAPNTDKGKKKTK